jgi:hypothetical protein
VAGEQFAILPELKAPTEEKGNVHLTFLNENAAERAEWKVGFRP